MFSYLFSLKRPIENNHNNKKRWYFYYRGTVVSTSYDLYERLLLLISTQAAKVVWKKASWMRWMNYGWMRSSGRATVSDKWPRNQVTISFRIVSRFQKVQKSVHFHCTCDFITMNLILLFSYRVQRFCRHRRHVVCVDFFPSPSFSICVARFCLTLLLLLLAYLSSASKNHSVRCVASFSVFLVDCSNISKQHTFPDCNK